MTATSAPLHIAAVATSYDTAFEPVAEQAQARAQDFTATFANCEWVGRLSFILKNDAPPERPFTSAAQAGLFEAAPQAVTRGDFVVEPLFGAKPKRHGRRGLAFIEGIDSALMRNADVIVAVNLNRKVAMDSVLGVVKRLCTTGADVAVGTRAPESGGVAHGAGRLGRTKSVAWRRAAHHALPELKPFSDPNAPVKAMRRSAAQFLVAHAREADICPDVEWLSLWARGGFTVEQAPITWTQRPGSRPPWTQVPHMLISLGRLRRRLSTTSLVQHPPTVRTKP